jgi:hypothetical protein
VQRRLLLVCLAVLVMSVTVISVGAPAQVKAAASLCPEPVNTYLQAPHQIPGDLDLCQWSALSLKGPYVTVQPVQTITYTSCTAWKEAVADWNTAGRPPTSVPGGVGQTRTVLDPVPVVLGKDPAKRGYFRIQVAFQPATGTPNPSRTIVSRPTWPGITTAQQQLDQIVARMLVHEEGHQNLGGFAAAAYDKVISVPAKNQKQAQQVLSDPAFIQEVRDLDALADESRNHVHDVYDAVTVHGRQQSSLGGIDISAFNCGTIDFTYSRLAAHASTGLVPCQLEPGTTGTFPSLLVKGTWNEETTFAPPPAIYTAQDESSSILGSRAGAECTGQAINRTVDVPGSPAASGEEHIAQKSVQVHSSILNPSTGITRAMTSEASARTTGTYVDTEGRLTVAGNITGSAAATDTAPPINSDQRLGPNCSPLVTYRFTVGSASTFSLWLEGQWSSSGNTSAMLHRTNGPGPGGGWGPSGAASLPGSWSTPLALTAGDYEFTLQQACLRTGLSDTGGYTYAPLNINYILKVEG